MKASPRTLTARLSLFYAALVISALGIGTAAFWAVSRWSGVMDELTQGYSQALAAEHLRANLNRVAKELTEILLRDENAPHDLAELQATVDARLAELGHGARSVEEVQWLARLAQLQSEVKTISERMLASMEQGNPEQAFRISEEELDQRVLPDTTRTLQALELHYLQAQQTALGGADEIYSIAMVFSGVILGLALLQLAGFSIFLQRNFRRPVDVIRRGTEQMRAGHLERTIDLDREDELGQLARDINQMAHSLRESREQLVQSERLAAVGEVAAYLAHNLRNPLAGILSAAQVGQEDAQDAEASRETFGDIIITIGTLTGWVNHLLDFVNPTKLNPAPSNPVDLMKSIVELTATPLAEHSIHLRLRVAKAPPRTTLDLPAMEQALSAVVLNAAEASPPGAKIILWADTPTPAPDTPGTPGTPPQLRIGIRDEGPGMTAAEAAAALKPFQTTKAKGSGLGLSMAQKIARAHGGELLLESTPGQGTTVIFQIPLNPSSAPQETP